VEEKSAPELQEHMLWTYYGLRVGLAAIGASLPVLLMLSGLVQGEALRGSLSDYYNAPSGRILTARDIFVGLLLATGACLYLYKGYSDKENIAFNFAGVFAVIVALFPTGPEGPVTYLHRTVAVCFFACIAYVCLFRAKDTLDLLPKQKRPRYVRLYKIEGAAMIASPLGAMGTSWWLGLNSGRSTVVLWIETFGVAAFVAYWATKTYEMRESDAEKLALKANLKRVVVPSTPPPAESQSGPSSKAQDGEKGEKVVPAA
jgi:hypothetical protein